MTNGPKKTWIRPGSANEAILAVDRCEVKKKGVFYLAVSAMYGRSWRKVYRSRSSLFPLPSTTC